MARTVLQVLAISSSVTSIKTANILMVIFIVVVLVSVVVVVVVVVVVLLLFLLLASSSFSRLAGLARWNAESLILPGLV